MTEQPPLKRLKPNENELYELPNGTGTRSFTKEQIEKMIRLLDESVRPPPPPTPVASTSAGPSQEAIAQIPLPTGMYRGRGRSRGRPRGFGNYGRGGHSMSPDFSANYMNRKRSADLAMAGSVKFSVAQWIALGKVPDCSEENKAKAARAKLWLENRVESVIASKPKLIWNNTIQEFVPPTPGDIPLCCG